MESRFIAKVIYQSYNSRRKDYLGVVRCNGRNFAINIAPGDFQDSPNAEARYRRFAAAYLEEDEFAFDEEQYNAGKEEPDPEHEIETFHEWLFGIFRPLFETYAPDVPPSFDPEMIRAGKAQPRLSEYLFPDSYSCKLVVKNDTPTHVQLKNGDVLQPPIHTIPETLRLDLARHVAFYQASDIVAEFEDPDDAQGQMPKRVLADLDKTGQRTTCFFKLFDADQQSSFVRELRSYLRLLQAASSLLCSTTRVIRPLGLVYGDNENAFCGLLLTYVNEPWKGSLRNKAWECQSPTLRLQWAEQVQETVGELHEAGLVWGDAKPENVMIDTRDNAWIVDLGGGYTEGWVDKDKAGTKEGDLQGVDKIRAYLVDESNFEL